MVVDNETIDSYLIQMDLPAEMLREGLWKVDNSDDQVPAIILRHDPPIVYLRLKIMDLPPANREALFQKLLEYNSSGIAFGAYAVEGHEVILIDTLRSDSLEMAELQASIESLIFAANEHYRELHALVHAEA